MFHTALPKDASGQGRRRRKRLQPYPGPLLRGGRHGVRPGPHNPARVASVVNSVLGIQPEYLDLWTRRACTLLLLLHRLSAEEPVSLRLLVCRRDSHMIWVVTVTRLTSFLAVCL